jgi:hypothetical protein
MIHDSPIRHMRARSWRVPWRLRRRLGLRLGLRLRLRLRLGLRLGGTCENETYRRWQAPNPVQQTNRKPCDKQRCCQRNEAHDSNFQTARLRCVLLDTSRRVGHPGSPPTFIGVPSKHARFSDCTILNTSPSRCLGLRKSCRSLRRLR